MLFLYKSIYMVIDKIVQEYNVSRDFLLKYLTYNKIDILADGSISQKDFQKVLLFIEKQDDRIDKVLNSKDIGYVSSDNRIRIYRDDAISFLEKLPSNSIDIITTDPAYSGMNNKLMLGKGRIVGKYSDKGTDGGKWFDEFEDSVENYTKFLTQCQRVLKKSTGHIYIMFDSFSLLTLSSIVRDFFDVKNLITWDKVNIGMGHYFRRRHEYILFATNGNSRKIKNRSFPDVWRFKRISNSNYPTQKPVEVFQAMIYASAEENYIVCDPFLGSASSAIAAIKNKCRFYGCDVSEKSMEISKERIMEFLNTGKDILQPNPSTIEESIFWQ